MTALADTSPPLAARIISEALAPGVVAVLLPILAGLPSGWRGLGWALLAVVFTAALPLAIILTGVRLYGLSSHHIDRREQRAIPLSLSVLAVAVGWGLLTRLNAPMTVRAAVAVLGAVGAVVTAANLLWKLSAHAATITAAAAALVGLYGPPGTIAALAVAAVCWARVRVGAHDLAQIAAGVVVGLVTGAAVWAAIG
ncbi:MAG: phosphoesterase PA-phosphatase [Catenulispora sp.]|nr:phosphoesterase PA-phosphatase [Catenulispora sp.]NUT40036.1 phosphoesterase PA-phosphatase [Thermoactinospora sp.]